MNSKQRVLTTLNHQIPDRMPLDIWTSDPIKTSLCRYYGVDDFEDVLQCLGIDIRSVWPAEPPWKLVDPDKGIREDPWGIRWKLLAGMLQPISHPLAEARSVSDVEAYSPPAVSRFDFDGLREQCAKWRQYALILRDPGPYSTCAMRIAMFLRGMEQFMLDLSMNPDLALAIIAKVEAYFLELNRHILEAVGALVDIYFIADDTGTESSLMMSPAMIRQFVHPSLEKFVRQGHAYGLKVMYHNEGAIRPLIPDYVKMGIDILNPVQVLLPGMDPVSLKEDFGDKLCFHGGMELKILSPVTGGTPERVSAEVTRLKETLGQGGGYILSTVNKITPDAPLEQTVANIVAMYETAHAVGTYR